LTQIETKKPLPSIYKLFTLASIYGLSYPQVLLLYGVDTKKVKQYHAEMPIAKTRLVDTILPRGQPHLRFPSVLTEALISAGRAYFPHDRILGHSPVEFIQHFDLRHRTYGFVGLKDYTLIPCFVRVFVEIDPTLRSHDPD